MIIEVHGRLSSSHDLLTARRRIYELAASTLEWDLPTTDRIDHPLGSPFVRNAIRCALVSGDRPDAFLPRIESWPFGEQSVTAGRNEVAVISDRDADDTLADVLATLDTTASPAFLTERDGPRMDVAMGHLAAGARLVRDVCSGLVDDLIPHVALIGMLRREAGRPPAVLSASMREFPGLIVLAEPRDAIEAAEALLHESAHCRFFDMAVVHDILPTPDVDGPEFGPSWRPTASWPLEQAVAALHAYAVLAEFHRDLTALRRSAGVGSDSLLPLADRRVAEVGDWVIGQLDRLGGDARSFIYGLVGRSAPHVVTPPRRTIRGSASVTIPDGVELRYSPGEGRSVAARTGSPDRLFVLGPDSGLVLHALMGDSAGDPVSAAIAAYSRERDVKKNEAEIVVGEIISALVDNSLVSVGEVSLVPIGDVGSRASGTSV